jgi:hypothetical protein
MSNPSDEDKKQLQELAVAHSTAKRELMQVSTRLNNKQTLLKKRFVLRGPAFLLRNTRRCILRVVHTLPTTPSL